MPDTKIYRGPLYLSDFKDSIRADFEKEIRRKRPDLAAILDDPDSESEIIVAESLDAKWFEPN